MLFNIPHIVEQIKKKLLDTGQVDEDIQEDTVQAGNNKINDTWIQDTSILVLFSSMNSCLIIFTIHIIVSILLILGVRRVSFCTLSSHIFGSYFYIYKEVVNSS